MALKDLALRRDFQSLEDGARVVLYPDDTNPLHREPVKAIFQGGYFFCDGSTAEEGPDYSLKEAAQYTRGFALEPRAMSIHERIAYEQGLVECREMVAEWMIHHSFATGHGDTLAYLLEELSWQVEDLRKMVQVPHDNESR